MLEYKAIPINACIFIALCFSCVAQCMISSARKVNTLSTDGRDSLDLMWNYCMAFSLLCVFGILYVATASASRAVPLLLTANGYTSARPGCYVAAY